MIPVANTSIGKEEAKAAYNIIKSGWISSGKKVKEFEKKFAKKVGSKFAIAVNNGTSALHIALIAVGVKEEDEVILPSLTFISTANAVLYQKAIPVLTECDPKTYNITADIIRGHITKRTKAIISVDMNGMPVDYDKIIKLAKKHKIPLIADSAESLGATYKNKKVGSLAPIHIFSFFPNKNITTGEGGMITTNNKKLADKMRTILNQGQKGRYNHICLGYNYRMTDIQAAIGIEQLKRLDKVIAKKEKLAQNYNRLFAGWKNIKTPFIPSYVTQHSWYMYAISVKGNRDKIVKELKKKGIETRLSFPPIHIQPIYKELFDYRNNYLPITYYAWEKLIDIPLWSKLKERQQKYIIKILYKLCEDEK